MKERRKRKGSTLSYGCVCTRRISENISLCKRSACVSACVCLCVCVTSAHSHGIVADNETMMVQHGIPTVLQAYISDNTLQTHIIRKLLHTNCCCCCTLQSSSTSIVRTENADGLRPDIAAPAGSGIMGWCLVRGHHKLARNHRNHRSILFLVCSIRAS